MGDVLVLNKSWVPDKIVSWQKAMYLFYKRHANAIDSDYIMYPFDTWIENTIHLDNYRKIRTVNLEIAVPEIIVLTTYSKLTMKEVKFTRQSIFQRDKQGYRSRHPNSVPPELPPKTLKEAPCLRKKWQNRQLIMRKTAKQHGGRNRYRADNQ